MLKIIQNRNEIYKYLQVVLQDIKLDEVSYLHSRFTKRLSIKEIAKIRQETIEDIEKKIGDILEKILHPLSFSHHNFSKKELLNFLENGFNNFYDIKRKSSQKGQMKPSTELAESTGGVRGDGRGPKNPKNSRTQNSEILSNADALPDNQVVANNSKNIWDIINIFLQQLDSRSKEIITQHYGEGKTLEVIGRELGITRERVRQIQSRNIQILTRKCQPYRLLLLNDIIEYQTSNFALIDEQFIQNFTGNEKLFIGIASKIFSDLPTYKNRIDFTKPAYIVKHKKEIEYLKKILVTEGEIRFIDIRDRIYRDHGEGVIKHLLVLYSHEGFVVENKDDTAFVRLAEEILKVPRKQKAKNKKPSVGRKPNFKSAKRERIFQFKDLDPDRKKYILSDESELINYLDENLVPKLSWDELNNHFEGDFQSVKKLIESSASFKILMAERSDQKYVINSDFSLLSIIKTIVYFAPYYQVDIDSMNNKLLILFGIESQSYSDIVNKDDDIYLINDFLMLDILSNDDQMELKKDAIVEWLKEFLLRLNRNCHLSHIQEALNDNFRLDMTVPQVKIVLEKHLNINLTKNNIFTPFKIGN